MHISNPSKMSTYLYYLATCNFFGHGPISLSSDNFVSLDGIPIKQVTRVQTICEVFNQQQSLKTFLTEVHKLLKLYLTIPVTTASSERNFSANSFMRIFLVFKMFWIILKFLTCYNGFYKKYKSFSVYYPNISVKEHKTLNLNFLY